MSVLTGNDAGNSADAATGQIVGFTVPPGGATVQQALQDVAGDTIFALGGDDTIQAGTGGDTIFGGDGNDRIAGGPPGSTTAANLIEGGSGDDSITGVNPYDRIFGDTGNDTITVVGAEFGVSGGAGADRITLNPLSTYIQPHLISYVESNAAITADFSTNSFSGGHATGDIITGFVSLVGSAFGDRIVGHEMGNWLDGGAGDDTIFGGDGADILKSGAGRNSLFGGDGQDALASSGTGGNLLDGGSGNDTVSYGGLAVASGVQVNLATGVVGGAATGDRLVGIEHLIGSGLADVLVGSAIGQSLEAGDGNDSLDGAGGDDVLLGGGGNDTLVGGAGNDFMTGQAGNDSLYGGLGDDWADASEGGDLYDGGVGRDLFRIWNGFGDPVITLNLATGQHQGSMLAGSTITGFEVYRGSSYADTMVGDTGDNTFDGSEGNDTLYGGAGNDVLGGGQGVDWLDGGAGIDTFTLDPRAVFSINLLTGIATGGSAVDNDQLRGFENVDVSESSYSGTLIGSNAANLLFGTYVNDTISGGGGNDTLRGNLGADRLEGGSGSDTFVFDFSAPSGIVRIVDFNAGDRIGLNNDGPEGFAELGRKINGGELRIGNRAIDDNDHLIFNDNRGLLLWDADADGVGSAVILARLTRGLDLTVDMFILL